MSTALLSGKTGHLRMSAEAFILVCTVLGSESELPSKARYLQLAADCMVSSEGHRSDGPESCAIQVDSLVRQHPVPSLGMRVHDPEGPQMLKEALGEHRPGRPAGIQGPQLKEGWAWAQHLGCLLQHVTIGPGSHILQWRQSHVGTAGRAHTEP